MKKQEIRYGVIDIPAGSALCTLEKGGDKDNKATYRFSDTDKRTTKRLVALITTETILQDYYNAQWAYTKKGWVKAENHITWYNSYKEAADALHAKTNRKKKILIGLLAATLTIAIGYMIYKFRNKTDITIQSTTNETLIPDEIPMD